MVGIKLIQADQKLLEQHYAEHIGKPFFGPMTAFMSSGPILATVWEGKDAVKQGRAMLGATNPTQSAPGTIRGDFGIDLGRNVCHGSDSVESANREIGIWFKKEELVEWKPSNLAWIYE